MGYTYEVNKKVFKTLTEGLTYVQGSDKILVRRGVRKGLIQDSTTLNLKIENTKCIEITKFCNLQKLPEILGTSEAWVSRALNGEKVKRFSVTKTAFADIYRVKGPHEDTKESVPQEVEGESSGQIYNSGRGKEYYRQVVLSKIDKEKDDFFTVLTLPSSDCSLEREILTRYPNVRLICYERDSEIVKIIKKKLPEAKVIHGNINDFRGTADIVWLDYCGAFTKHSQEQWRTLQKCATTIAITVSVRGDTMSSREERVNKIREKSSLPLHVLETYRTKQDKGITQPMIFALACKSPEELTDRVF